MISIKVLGANELKADLSKFANKTEDNCTALVSALLNEGFTRASGKFSSAIYSGYNDVNVSIKQEGTKGEIIADGDSVAFIEFGTGVTNAEHPMQSQVKGIVSHGKYGEGKGANPKGWVYYGVQGNGSSIPIRDKDGNAKPFTYRTWGEPANRCLYDTALELDSLIIPLAEEIFK